MMEYVHNSKINENNQILNNIFFSIEINSMSYSYKCIAECLIYGVDKNTRNRLVFIIRKADHGCRGNSRDPPTAH